MRGQLIDGNPPPQAIELEEAIIGACLIESDAFKSICNLIEPSMFYKDSHAKIFEAIGRVHSNYAPIDMLTVTEQLRLDGNLEAAGGVYYISQLTNKVGSAAHIHHHAFIVKERWYSREQINICTEAVNELYSGADSSEASIQIQSKLRTALEKMRLGSERTMSNKLDDYYAEVYQKVMSDDKLAGVSCGYSSLDAITGGFRRGEMIVIGGLRGMAKTAFMLQLSLNNISNPNKELSVGIYSLEMSMNMLLHRLAANKMNISSVKLQNGTLDKHELGKLYDCLHEVKQKPITIDDRVMDIDRLCSEARQMKVTHGIDILYVDFLQKVSAVNKKESREQQVADISDKLQKLAKELNIPVVVLASLSRAAMNRESRMPELSDLRDSGAIESDARVVMFLDRPEVHTENGFDKDGRDVRGMCVVRVAKNNNGKTGDCVLKFVAETQRFYDWDDRGSFV